VLFTVLLREIQAELAAGLVEVSSGRDLGAAPGHPAEHQQMSSAALTRLRAFLQLGIELFQIVINAKATLFSGSPSSHCVPCC